MTELAPRGEGPWLVPYEQNQRQDIVITSTDATLDRIIPLIEQRVGVDLESGADLRGLTVAVGPMSSMTPPPDRVLIAVGSDPVRVGSALGSASLVEVCREPTHPNAVATVGVHGFSDRTAAEDSSFSLQQIDDWGIEDVMATALDIASRQSASLATLFDLAVLDPIYGATGPRSSPGGLDMRRLARAARAAGRHPEVVAAGFVMGGSPDNLAHAVLSFCVGLATR